LHPKQLVDLGLPGALNPVLWFTGLGVATYALAALALAIVEARINGENAARHIYALACFSGAFGLALLVLAPDSATGSAGVLVVGGIALTVTRAVGVIWVNRRATSEVRATVQSFLAQAEYLGEITLGVAFGVLAQATTISISFAAAAVLFACTGLMVRLTRTTTGLRMVKGAHVE
jgi:hypothetical protein